MAGVDLTRINSNIAAMNTLNSLRDVNKNLGVHQARLASGKRINEAADDPAGLTLATKFGVRSASQQQAIDNIGDAKNLLSVAEGGLKKINEIMGKMRVKAEQAASDTLGDAERTAIAKDLSQYAEEIDNIVNETNWNGQKLLTKDSSFKFQTGVDLDNTTTFAMGQAHDVEGSGPDGLNLASKTTSASGAIVNNGAGTAFTSNPALAASGTTHSALGGLQSGTYTVSVVIGSTNGSAADSYIQLLDANGNPLAVDADATGTSGLVDYKSTFTYDTASAETVNFGNGLEIQVAAGLSATDEATGTVSWTASGNYTLTETLTGAAGGDGARNFMAKVDSAISKVSESISKIGALMDRFSFKEDTLAIGKVNTEAAFNRIMNADMAEEQLSAVKFQILQQTATTMLAQTNQAPNSIMQLFR